MKNGIDLHLHLDGSLSPEFVMDQARKQGLDLPAWEKEELTKYLCVPDDCRDLNEYLEKFELPGSVLQTEDAITAAVQDLCERLQSQGLVYVEIRFAPQLHLKKGLSQEEVVKSAIRGLVENDVFHAELILCCMRMGNNEHENLETIHMTAKYLGKGVVAADLAGAEALFATEQFDTVFEEARRLNIPFTIHAGEAAGPESIWAALKLGAKRIGHGVRCLEDETLVSYLKEHKIPLEVCLTSNLQTKAVSGVHPLKEMLEKGLCVTLNTDNMMVSNTTLQKEFELAKSMFELTEKDIQRLIDYSRRARFTK